MEKVSKEIRTSFNEWFERFLKEKDGNVTELTIGDIWNAYLAGVDVKSDIITETNKSAFCYQEGKPLRIWKELSESEREYLDTLSIYKNARYLKTISINALTKAGVKTFGQLARMSRIQLVKLKGVAQSSVEMASKDLKGMGLKLTPCYTDLSEEE